MLFFQRQPRWLEHLWGLEGGVARLYCNTMLLSAIDVRNATIDSIGELGDRCAELALRSLDFLVDMFNDDNDSVRLNAIHTLRKLSRHFEFNEEHLEIMLGALDV